MTINLDVFSIFMVNWISGNVDSCGVISKKSSWLGASNANFHKKPSEPYNFKTYKGYKVMLNLYKGFGYLFLFLTFPKDRRITQKNTPPYGKVLSINIYGIIHISKYCEIKRYLERKYSP